MTKKAIQEKYRQALEMVSKDMELYRNDVIEDINKYNNTNYNACSLNARELRIEVIQTLEIIEDVQDKRIFLLNYECYQKLRREYSLIAEILEDIR